MFEIYMRFKLYRVWIFAGDLMSEDLQQKADWLRLQEFRLVILANSMCLSNTGSCHSEAIFLWSCHNCQTQVSNLQGP